MEDVRITLSGLWVATMLIYLLGDVLRVFSGDSARMDMSGVTQAMWLGIAALMTIPIVMVVVSLAAPHDAARWANLVAAVFFLLFNLVSVSTYPSAYDKFLLVVSMVFNVLVVWYAWKWA